jgi:hypothetical protein
LKDETLGLLKGFSRMCSDLSSHSELSEKDLGNGKLEKVVTRKCGLDSSNLQDVYSGEPIGVKFG